MGPSQPLRATFPHPGSAEQPVPVLVGVVVQNVPGGGCQGRLLPLALAAPLAQTLKMLS